MAGIAQMSRAFPSVPSDIHCMQVWLPEHIGVNVNVVPAGIVAFEALRRNLGVHKQFNDTA